MTARLAFALGALLASPAAFADDVISPPAKKHRQAFDDTLTGDPSSIKEFTFTYSLKVTYAVQRTLVELAVAQTETHRNDHFGVTGEISFTQGDPCFVDLFYADGTTETRAIGRDGFRLELPAKRVRRLLMRYKHYGQSWNIEWDLMPVPPGRLSLTYRDAAAPKGPPVVQLEFGRHYIVDVYRDGTGDPPALDVAIGEPGWAMTLSATKVQGERNRYRTGPFVVYPRAPQSSAP